MPRNIKVLFTLTTLLLCSAAYADTVTATVSTTSFYNSSQESLVTFSTSNANGTIFGTFAGGGQLSLTSQNANMTTDPVFAGQFGVQATDGSLDILTLSATGQTFTDLVADVYGVFPDCPVSTDTSCQTFTIAVNFADGGSPLFLTVHVTPGVATDNFIKIESTDNGAIQSVVFGSPSPDRFYALDEVGISGAVSTVPEPSSLLLLSSGVLGTIGLVRRKFSV